MRNPKSAHSVAMLLPLTMAASRLLAHGHGLQMNFDLMLLLELPRGEDGTKS